MSEYMDWVDRVSQIPFDFDTEGAIPLESHNDIEVISLNTGEKLVRKTITDHVVYVPRINILGSVAYSLFDYHLDGERVTPNVCPVDKNKVWRQYVVGYSGDDWRGHLYSDTKGLASSDLAIVDAILNTPSAQRIALLDFVFMCQDRSARNWLKSGNVNFWAIDNNMLWPYRGRQVDKRVIETGNVDHLADPINALVPSGNKFTFGIGIFSSAWASRPVGLDLLIGLNKFDWEGYFDDLSQLIAPLGYPKLLIDDWRISQIFNRVEYILARGAFPTRKDLTKEWGSFTEKIKGGVEVWKRKWEINNF